MTGEITLTGQVLQIGGVREKVLAAQRAGLKKVILPRENEADLDELPPETRERARVRPRRHVEEVLEAALDRQTAAARRPRARDRAPGCAELLVRLEGRLQQSAGARLGRVRRPAAEHVVLALPAQDERDPVDQTGAVLLVGEVVLARADPATTTVRRAITFPFSLPASAVVRRSSPFTTLAKSAGA